MGRFLVDLMAQGVIQCHMDVSFRKREVIIPLCLHGELDFLVKAIQMIKKQIPEDVKEELETLCICDQGVLKLRHHDQDASKARPQNPVCFGPEVSKVHSLIELCGLRMLKEMYITLKGFYNAGATSSSAIHSITADK